jgi:GTPase
MDTIAIIGRPNVGKSTLFNRLVGKRLALVDPSPGLTRDRKDVEVELYGRTIRLVDTAGLEDAVAGSVTAKMREQSELAIAEADLVLFVIDARTGIVADDQVFAEVVRKSGKPVLLVVNKCEGRAGTEGYYEAFTLGLGEPLAISAEHNEGISDLIMESLARLTPIAEPKRSDSQIDEYAEEPSKDEEYDAAVDPMRPLRICVVGRPNAGKSTLVNTILGEERMITGPEAGITRDAIAIDFVYRERPLKLFDTAGLRRKSRIEEKPEQLAAGDTIRAIRFAEVVVLLVEAGRAFEHQDLQIAELVASEGRALVIGINKWDTVVDKQKRLKDFREEVEKTLPQVKGVMIEPISAQSGHGIGRLMHSVFTTYETWNKRIGTPALNRWLGEATERHAPPAVSGRRLKLRYITQPNARPPTFVLFTTRADAVPISYVRYLTNSLRDAFDLPAVPIRLQLRQGGNPFDKS